MATIEFHIDPTIFNDAYYPQIASDVHTQIFFGGASSGKSYFAIGQRMIIDLLNGGRNYLAVRNVGRTLRTSVFNEAVKGISHLNAQDLFRVNKTEMTITCTANGYQAILKGLDDVEKVKSITPEKGIITDILIEEATEISSEDPIKQLERRLRGISDKKKRVTFLFNPIYRTHWIYKRYFSGKWNDDDTLYQDDDLLILKTTYRDNRFLEEEDRVVLESEKNTYWYDVYTLGKWGILGDLIFTDWEVSDMQGQYFDYFYNGMDFGYSNDPTAAVRSAVKEKTLYITDEMIYECRLFNDKIAERLKVYLGKDMIRCDSAAPKDIAEIRSYGINAVPALKGPGSLNYGIQYLQQHHIMIDRSCQNVINEFQLYQWDKDKDGNTINKPIDKFNHAIDALRYAHEPRMAPKRAKPMTKEEMGFF